MMTQQPRITVGVPFYGPHSPRFTYSLSRLLVNMARQGILLGDLAPAQGSYIDEARNLLVEMALAAKATHLLLLDHDVTCPPEAALRLAQHRKPVVGAWYRDKGREHRPTAFEWMPETTRGIRRLTEKGTGLRPVGGVPMGCTLIETGLLRELRGPWFQLPYEDVYFCSRCRDSRVTVFLDQDLECGHVGETVWDETTVAKG